MPNRTRSAIVYATVCATVVALAVGAHSETSRRVVLDDGGVWVTSGRYSGYGRLNKQIAQLDAAVFGRAGASDDVDVLQDGDAVLAWDRGTGTLAPVDVAQRALANEGVAMTPASQAALAGGSAAVLSEKNELRVARGTGNVIDVTALGSAALPALRLTGPAGALAVGVDGAVHVARSGELVTLRPVPSGFGKPATNRMPETSKVAVTAVGGTPVVLDAPGRRLILPETGRTVALPGAAGGLRLQQAGPTASTVVVADDTTLWLVPLRGGSPRRVSTGGTGRPVAPVRVGRCVHAAWQGGRSAYVRSCDDGDATAPRAFSDGSGGTAVFRVNRGQVVLNDTATGAVVVVDDAPQQLQRLWDRIVPQVSDNPDKTKVVVAVPHVREDRPPRAVDDTVGARPERATVLHLLDNDTDPEGDLLVISAVTAPDLAGATAVIAPDGQAVVVTVPSGATGAVHFRYTADDGYGKSASASVTVQLRSTDDNALPMLRRAFRNVAFGVAPGGTLRLPAVSDWRDYDGDPPLVTRERASAGALAATSDGSLLFTAPSRPGSVTLTYAVTDGITRDATPAPKIAVTVLDPDGARPFTAPVARPDAVRVVVGQPMVVEPLANDLPGADATDPQVTLAIARDVSAKPGLEVSTDVVRGRVSIRATRPGAYLLAYTAAFGAAPVATGVLRVDAAPATGRASEPVAMPDSAILRGQRPVVVDVLSNDFDPAGGMLVVQDATADDDAGIAVSVLDGRALRIVADGSGTVTSAGVRYRITNGPSAPVTGSVAVTLLAADAKNTPPLAVNDAVVVRAGDSTAVAVLDNDFDADGDTLALAPLPVPVELPGAAAAVSGRFLRFAAPASVTEPQQLTLDYVVEDPAGERATGRVAVSVVPPGTPADDQPPTPKDVEGRLVAGDTYAAHVPAYGVDPDGDSVTLTGVVKPPALGRVVATTADTVTYQAYPDSVGTDSFTYEVTDAYGRSGQATVRLGIVAPGALSAPTAVDDDVSAIPGRTVRVDVTQNDLARAGSRLTVLPLERFGPVPSGARLDGDVVTATVPAAGAAPVVVAYAVTDGTGEPSVAHLTLRPQPDSPLPPVARDDAPGETEGRATVTVDVMANDDDPDGDPASLDLSVFDPEVKVDGGRLVVPVHPQPHQVAYQVKDTDGLIAMAALRVPGSEVRRPRLKPGARLRVPAAGSITASLADLVVSPSGRPVRLTTTDRLAASPDARVGLTAPNATSLVVRALGAYTGPGAVSFQVTDGKSLQDPAGALAQITVPVQVGADAPALRCPATPVTVVPGGADLVADVGAVCHVWIDTTVPQPALAVTASWRTDPGGVGMTVDDGTRLLLRAASSARPGSKGSVSLAVPGTPAKAQLPVIVRAAPRPRVRAVTLNGLRAARATTVDLAQYVTSPLREPRLVVASVDRTSGDAATTSVAGTKVTITPGRDSHGVAVFTAVVADLPGRPDRQVRVVITATVQGRPARPGRPDVTSVGNREVVLRWPAPANNGAPIQRYEIGGGRGHASCFASPCPVTGLTNGASYTFTVTAVNVVGKSDPSPSSAPATPDRVPNAVTGIVMTPRDKAAGATWRAPGGGGTPVVSYQVEISPAPRSGAAIRVVRSPSAALTSLDNGVTYRLRVRARNSAPVNGGYGPWSAAASVKPYGAPLTMAAPVAAGADVPDPVSTRAITVSWPAADGNGRAVTHYAVAQYVDSADTGSFSTKVTEFKDVASAFGGPGSFSKSFTVPNDGRFYRFTVRAFNAGGKGSAPSAKSNPVQGAAPPDKIDGITARDHPSDSSTGYDNGIRVRYTIPAAHARTITAVEYQLNGAPAGRWDAPGSPGETVDLGIGGLANGTTYVVQVRGCNEASLCGPWSDQSNQVVPYGAPGAPSVGADQSGNSVNYSWNGGGGNGRPVQHYRVCIDGGCSDQGAGGTSRNYGYSTSWRIDVYVVDTAGQVSATVTRTGSTPPIPRTITVSKGAAHTAPGCTSAYCRYVHVEVRNFAPNTRYGIAYYCDYPASSCSPWSNNSFTTNSAGSASFEGQAWYGWPGKHVWVTAGGLQSNHLTW